MTEKNWTQENLKVSREPLLEILRIIKNSDLDTPLLQKDLERTIGVLTFWIEE